MYITNDDYKKLEWAIDFLVNEITEYHLKDAHPGTKKRVFDAYCVLLNLQKKKAQNNSRQREYIKRKRETDPKYFRSKKDWERYKAQREV